MPPRNRRNPRNRRRRNTNNKLRIQKHPVPPNVMVKLRYVGHNSINPSADVAAGYVASCNSLFDPNVTGVGHQPYGFDQWALFYKRYLVLGSKCTATFYSQSSTASGTANVGVGVRDGSTIASSDINYWMEQDNTAWKQLGTLSSGNNAITQVTKTYSAKRYFNNDPKNDDDQAALVTASPAKQAYFHMIMSGTDNSADPPSTDVQFVIEYIAYFDQVAQLAQS